MSRIFDYYFDKDENNSVAVLPDFFLDILVDPNFSYKEFQEKMDKTFHRGGGNILGSSFNFLPGGNGGNVALVTNQLGMETYFIGETSGLGFELINYFYRSKGIKIFFNTLGELSASFILEFKNKSGKTNIMVSSSKSLRNYGPKKLSDNQINVIKQSGFVCITNFQNSKLLDLINYIFEITDKNQIVSIDFSDLSPHKSRIKEIYELFTNNKDREFIVTGNENEISMLASLLPNSTNKEIQNTDLDHILLSLSKTFRNIAFCLHSADFSSTAISGKLLSKVKTLSLPTIKRATGAGDSWHGGLITAISLSNCNQLGIITKNQWKEIIQFANYVAGYWVSIGSPGSISEIKEWIETISGV